MRRWKWAVFRRVRPPPEGFPMSHRDSALAALLAVCTAFLFFVPEAAFGQNQNALARDGLCITVPSPITSEKVTDIRNRIQAARTDANRRPSVIVFDFNPNEKDSHTSEFGGAFDLTDLIAGVSDVTTVAFVHGNLTGHAVWPALACTELVMSPAAKIGEIVPTGGSLPEVKADAILALGSQRRSGLRAVVRKMYNPDVVILEGKDKAGGVVYIDQAEKGEFEKKGGTVTNTKPVVPGGRVELYTADL